MEMNMEQMQMMMARMHYQNYVNDTKLAQHFYEIANIYTEMAKHEYEMYQMHAGQENPMPMKHR